jgi:flagellar assembly protein FliH
MPLSKNIIEKESAKELAINYQPKTIDSVLSEEALEYVRNHEARGDFRVDKIVSEFTGIEEIEKQSQQKEIADQALKLSQEVQEKAYKEAYALGLKEGKEKAYHEEKERIDGEMEHMVLLIEEIKNIKTNLEKENEKQLAKLCFYMAKRLLMKEIIEDEAYIMNLTKKTIEMVQSDENITIRVSPEDLKWIEENKTQFFQEVDVDASTKIEEDRDISRGGVIIESQFGVIDARVEERLEKLEKILDDHN